ncbi:MAG: hypothetical protein MSH16_08865 [Oscillospiraceae bacterium]|nr:hypothetical protein [Oscillospiraceae bacterium]
MEQNSVLSENTLHFPDSGRSFPAEKPVRAKSGPGIGKPGIQNKSMAFLRFVS